jgi:2-oxoglutarate dehydrogenase E2 component (dihydrolipoamide succinyltransferase)
LAVSGSWEEGQINKNEHDFEKEMNMAVYELTLPAMGEGIIEAAITRWFVKKGEKVNADQPLLEVATDKVDSEIPSPVEGMVIRLVYNEGEVPKVGEVIALIETPGEEGTIGHRIQDARAVSLKPDPESPKTAPTPAVLTSVTRVDPESPFVSPLVRLLARQRGIRQHELKKIPGTGMDGRITKEDMLHYLENRKSMEPDCELDNPSEETSKSVQIIPPPYEEGDEWIEMDRMRKLIAAHMIRSKRISPHVTSFLEADITNLAAWRERNREVFQQREQVKLTFTPLFVEAVAQALKEFPGINVSVSGDHMILHRNINIGIATALANGNLIVPVLRNADLENLGGLARKITDLASRARMNELLPAEIKGGTFTITNIGQYNNLTGTPIINQPEAAILAIGTVSKKPWAVKTQSGYGLAVRDITMLSLTYDHRVIDGALGGSFLSRIASLLEQFNPARTL